MNSLDKCASHFRIMMDTNKLVRIRTFRKGSGYLLWILRTF